MGMFSSSDTDKLKYVLEIGYLDIVFGSDDIIKEFTLEDKGNKNIKIMVRNQKDDGVNGKPIPHSTATIKFIRGTEFKYDGMLGVPFEFENEVKLYKDADNNHNKSKLSQADLKLIKTFIKWMIENVNVQRLKHYLGHYMKR